MLVSGAKWSLGTHCSWPRPLATTVKHHIDHCWSGPQPPWPRKILSGQSFLLFFPLHYAAKHFLLFRKDDYENNRGLQWKHCSINCIKWNHIELQIVWFWKGSYLPIGHSCGKSHPSFLILLINLLLFVDGHQTCASHVWAEQGWVVNLHWSGLGSHHEMISLSRCNPDHLHVCAGMLWHQKRQDLLPPRREYKLK